MIRRTMVSLLTFVVLGGIILAWSQANNLHSIQDALNWFKKESHKISHNCGAAQAQWNCGGHVSLPAIIHSLNGKPSGGNLTSAKTTLATTPTARAVRATPWSAAKYQAGHCSPTQTVLRQAGYRVKTGKNCSIVSGTWWSPYDGATTSNPKLITMDYVVPISYAAAHGGAGWSSHEKKAFTVDPLNELPATVASAGKKHGRSPAHWLPRKAFLCQYSSLWIKVVNKYKLSLASSDKKTLTQGIAACK